MSAALAAALAVSNPYVGPRPFEREDENKLFGRDEEIRELLAIITATPITLLYAQSGAGKTSLLKAKLQPLLERRPCEVYGPLRVASPESSKSGVKNVYTFNALSSFTGPNIRRPLRMASATLTEFLEKQPKPEVRRGAIRMPRVLLFDQFEDLFTRYPERWEDRGRFFEDVTAALAADPRLRIVFGMREEYLASFESYAPDLPTTSIARFRLERLRRTAAAEAVEKPLEGTNVRFKPRALEKLLNNLMSLPKALASRSKYEEFAEAVQLQIVCLKLWDSTQQLRTGAEAEWVEIDTDAVKVYGNVEEALRAYYTSCINEITADFGTVHHFHSGKLRSWFERTFINDEGQRSMVYKGATMTAGFSNDIIAALERKYLIRTEPRGTATWCELSHERFIKPVMESNRIWRREADVGNRAGSLERRASQWAKEGKSDQLLLTGIDVRNAQAWLASNAVDILPSRTLEEYVETSARRQQVRAAARLRLIVLLSIAGALMVGWFAIEQYRISRKATALRVVENDLHKRALATARNEVGLMMLREDRPMDALAWAVKAVAEAPELPETIATLRTALDVTSASAAWLRRPNAPINMFSFSPDNRLALTQSATEVCVWDLAGGGPPRCRPSPIPGYWYAAKFSRDAGFVVAMSVDEDPRAGKFIFRPSVWHTDGRLISPRIRLASNPWLLDGCGAKNLLAEGAGPRLSLFDTVSGQERSVPLPDVTNRGAVSLDCASVVTTSDTVAAAPVALWSRILARRDLPLGDVGGSPGTDIALQPSFDDSARYLLIQVTSGGASQEGIVYDLRTRERVRSQRFSPPADHVTIVGGKWIVAAGTLEKRRVLDYYDIATGVRQGLVNDLMSDRVERGTRANTTITRSGNMSIVDSIDLLTHRRSRAIIPDAGFADFTVSRDGRWLMTQKNGVVRVWNLDAKAPQVAGQTAKELLSSACSQLTRFGYDSDLRNECSPKSASAASSRR
ncbi:MAG TPA: hypothetical protein VE974_11080 [Thermoanaerobaculia bacterium]|nr:hypothetical protein [Thermoanaerobaculia bacterium]